MGVRLKDVAAALGLSISTVSAVLRNRTDFNEATRLRVLAKVKELNYRPNRLARSLATQKSHVIGVVVPNLSRSFYPNVLEGIDLVTQNAGYQLVISNTGDIPEREDDGISTLVDRQVDGMIIASAHPPGQNQVKKIMNGADVPYVLIDRFFPGAPFVGSDDDLIGLMATRHLIKQGYRSIAHFSRRIVATGLGRHRGFVRAMREAGLPIPRHFVLDAFGEPGGYEAMKTLLKEKPYPDAIFAASDPVAIGAMRALEERGLRVPDDVGVIGVGCVRYGEDLRVPLSTVDTHSFDIGKCAASILLQLIGGKAAPELPVYLEPTLVERASTGGLKKCEGRKEERAV
jgi:LacI family transcriptional regulator